MRGRAKPEPVTVLMEIKRNELTGPDVGKAMKDAAMKDMMGKLPFGGKKKETTPEEPKWEEKIKFSSTSELIEVNSDKIDPGKFEVPAGYKLKKK